jgi:hypothetical protein
MFRNLISSRYAQINATLTNECGNVGGGQENQSERVVLDERNVKP